jgi:hypothetical protein
MNRSAAILSDFFDHFRQTFNRQRGVSPDDGERRTPWTPDTGVLIVKEGDGPHAAGPGKVGYAGVVGHKGAPLSEEGGKV